MKELYADHSRMFSLKERDDGRLLFSAVCGGFAMFEASFWLDDVETSQYRDEGASYIEKLASEVCKNSDAFRRFVEVV